MTKKFKIDEMVELCEDTMAILDNIDACSTNENACEFALSAKETVSSILESVTNRKMYTQKQYNAVENIQEAAERWEI